MSVLCVSSRQRLQCCPGLYSVVKISTNPVRVSSTLTRWLLLVFYNSMLRLNTLEAWMMGTPVRRCQFYPEMSRNSKGGSGRFIFVAQFCYQKVLRAGYWMHIVRQPRHPITMFQSQKWLSQQQICAKITSSHRTSVNTCAATQLWGARAGKCN